MKRVIKWVLIAFAAIIIIYLIDTKGGKTKGGDLIPRQEQSIATEKEEKKLYTAKELIDNGTFFAKNSLLISENPCKLKIATSMVRGEKTENIEPIMRKDFVYSAYTFFCFTDKDSVEITVAPFLADFENRNNSKFINHPKEIKETVYRKDVIKVLKLMYKTDELNKLFEMKDGVYLPSKLFEQLKDMNTVDEVYYKLKSAKDNIF